MHFRCKKKWSTMLSERIWLCRCGWMTKKKTEERQGQSKTRAIASRRSMACSLRPQMLIRNPPIRKGRTALSILEPVVRHSFKQQRPSQQYRSPLRGWTQQLRRMQSLMSQMEWFSHRIRPLRHAHHGPPSASAGRRACVSML